MGRQCASPAARSRQTTRTASRGATPFHPLQGAALQLWDEHGEAQPPPILDTVGL